MKSTVATFVSIWIVCLALSACVERPFRVDFDYTLTWKQDRLGVDLLLRPTRRDTVTLLYGSLEWGGQADIFGCVQNLKVKGADYLADSVAMTLRLFNLRQETLHITYQVVGHLPSGQLNCPMEMFRPNMKPNLLYCHGVNLFFRYPEEEAEIASQRVTWDRVPRFPVFCLYNPGRGLEPIEAMANDFQSTLIVGDSLLQVDSLLLHGVPHYVVTAPRADAAYNNQTIKDFFAQYYQASLDFWEDDVLQPYSLIVYPFDKILHPTSGTGLHNGFCARYAANTDTILTPERIELFAHEVGHKWIGSDFENQWFGEGFNEMQTMYMIVASGVRPPGAFTDYLNEAIDKLHHSAIAHLPNDSISTHFWELGDYSWIPYWRGAVYAFRLLGQMEAHTADPHIFKHLMMELKPYCNIMTRIPFMEGASKFLDRNLLEKEFDQYIMQAQTLTLDHTPLLTGCGLRHQPDGTPYVVITDTLAFVNHFN